MTGRSAKKFPPRRKEEKEEQEGTKQLREKQDS